MTEPPSSAEIMRRVEELVRSVERLAATMEASYVRREVYEAKHDALRSSLEAAIREVADDVHQNEAARRRDQAASEAKVTAAEGRWKQALMGAGVQLLFMLILGVLAVSNFMARGGAG